MEGVVVLRTLPGGDRRAVTDLHGLHGADESLKLLTDYFSQVERPVLLVTHDAFCASYAGRILFLKDGRIFTELHKGSDSRRTFYEKILNVLTMSGGGQTNVC